MSTRLRDLARRALVERRPDAVADAEIERLVVDVRMGERVEMVTISVREGRLAVLASDAPAASSPAAGAVLRWLASDAPRSSLPPEPRPATSPGVVGSTDGALDVALADLATAIVRAGTDAAQAPAIDDALARIESASRALEVARFAGRLRGALAAKDAIEVARLLETAPGLELEEEPQRLVDHVLVELGRELVDGWTPSAIERRYLLDPSTGNEWVEERRRDEAASHGPFPRVVSAGLATCTGHGRVRIVQYAVAPLDADVLARVGARAEPSIGAALARARDHGLGTAAREPGSARPVPGRGRGPPGRRGDRDPARPARRCGRGERAGRRAREGRAGVALRALGARRDRGLARAALVLCGRARDPPAVSQPRPARPALRERYVALRGDGFGAVSTDRRVRWRAPELARARHQGRDRGASPLSTAADHTLRERYVALRGDGC